MLVVKSFYKAENGLLWLDISGNETIRKQQLSLCSNTLFNLAQQDFF